MRAGYKVMLPLAILDDVAQLDGYIAQIAEDMPRLADGCHPLTHETVPGTTEVRWTALQLPRVNDFGATVVLERGEPWERGTPLPEWAEAVVLWVCVGLRALTGGPER